MFDLQYIREKPIVFDEGLQKRFIDPKSNEILDLDEKHRECKTSLQQLQERRNKVSKEIGPLKAKGENADKQMQEVAEIKEKMKILEEEERQLKQSLDAILSSYPNLPHGDVPTGKSEDDNLEVRRVGEPKSFDFKAKEHYELGKDLQMMDFETAAKISGSRFVILSGALARLERALSAFMLDLHVNEFDYSEVSPPVLVKSPALFGTGQLPKFEEDLFKTTDGFYLIPTAEVSLTNIVREKILNEESLPLRYTALTPCFRSEAGAAGKDTHGMIRQHQFSKVELVSICTAEESERELERMVGCAEEVLKRLDIAYRVMMLSSGDMGFSASKTYDIEVWLPGQNQYREISSCSMCLDFQSRRMNARYKSPEHKKPRYVHTLNGSGLAIGRTLIAILENYQLNDGSVEIPTVLRPYMGGIERISLSE